MAEPASSAGGTLLATLLPAGAVAALMVDVNPRQAKRELCSFNYELAHVRQWRESYGMFWIRYLVSKKWRRHYEVDAYCEQLKHSSQDLDLYAGYLSENYRLGISKEVARTFLSTQPAHRKPMADIDKNAQKEALKEALKEWLDEQFAAFGRWTFTGLLAAASAGLVYLALKGQGWNK